MRRCRRRCGRRGQALNFLDERSLLSTFRFKHVHEYLLESLSFQESPITLFIFCALRNIHPCGETTWRKSFVYSMFTFNLGRDPGLLQSRLAWALQHPRYSTNPNLSSKPNFTPNPQWHRIHDGTNSTVSGSPSSEGSDSSAGLKAQVLAKVLWKSASRCYPLSYHQVIYIYDYSLLKSQLTSCMQ